MKTIKKIIICEDCNGTGDWESEELIDHHKNEYSKIYMTCGTCEGSGRMIEEIKRVLTPYKKTIKTEV